MDADPELDVTRSDGRRVTTFQITPLDRDLGTWISVEPAWPRRVILGDAEALTMRRHIDVRIARPPARSPSIATPRVPPGGRAIWHAT